MTIQSESFPVTFCLQKKKKSEMQCQKIKLQRQALKPGTFNMTLVKYNTGSSENKNNRVTCKLNLKQSCCLYYRIQSCTFYKIQQLKEAGCSTNKP